MSCFPNANFSFEEVRKRGLSYIDKTGHALRLLTSRNMTSFFLSRPRRFGKSLFLSTLKSALEGKSELFDGLAMNRGNYGFEKFPVIHLDMGYIDASSQESFNGGMN
ncbi:MAG: AAA family ATPase, partial [Deltaproteobacteria bacterium]|nr:AAA family ATPase [Deltaproteobacteria bacterium]